MRKLFILFILVLAGFSLFAQHSYNEGSDLKLCSASELFTKGGGQMERYGNHLRLNGRDLLDSEVKELVSFENYETYLSAKKQITTSKSAMGVFIVSSVSTVTLFFVSVASKNTTLLYVTYISALVACASLPVMCIYGGIGKGRMSWVADEYNKQNSSSVSYNISPSIIRNNIIPEQAQLGLGMTFSVNF